MIEVATNVFVIEAMWKRVFGVTGKPASPIFITPNNQFLRKRIELFGVTVGCWFRLQEKRRNERDKKESRRGANHEQNRGEKRTMEDQHFSFHKLNFGAMRH
jgi:hypothetical protein